MSNYLRTEEGSHWYDKHGNPVHEVPKKGGGFKPTTLADARKLILFPSVSTVLKFPFDEKMNLVGYHVDQALEAVLTSPQIHLDLPAGRTLKEFCDEILIQRKDQREESDAAKEFGSLFHACSAKGIVGESYDERMQPWVEPAIAYVKSLGRVIEVEKTFADTRHGFGGTRDVVVEAPDGTIIIVDYKSTKRLPKDEPWSDHCKQVSAYGLPFGERPVKGIVIYLLNDTAMKRQWWKTEVEIRPLEVPDMIQPAKAFLALLDYWKITKGYFPKA